MKLFLVYDIQEDKARTKVAAACKDYGLRRVQYSTFFGDLNRNRQEELMQRVRRVGDLAVVLEAGAPQSMHKGVVE